MAADQGTGTTIVWATSAFTADLISIGASGASRGDVDTTHMGTTTAKTFEPEDIADNGEVSMTIAFLGNQTLPTLIAAAVETITIDWSGTGAGYTWAFDGYCKSFDVTGEINEKMTADLTLKISGDITVA